VSENLRIGYASAVINMLGGVSNFAVVPEAQILWGVERLTDTILNSKELKQAIHTAGSTKLSETQVLRFRLSFIAEIVETGLQSSEPKTSST
jgi:hypothetical protein